MYEGRTRGKRIKYTYSDEEDAIYSDSTSRRSARNTGTNTPAETGPVTTLSGRQIRAPPRLNPATGESAPGSVQGDTPEYDEEASMGATGRPRRSAAANNGANGESSARSRRNDSYDSEEESEAEFGDDEEDVDVQAPEESEEEDEFDEDEAMVDDDLDDKPRSLVVKLSVTPPKLRNALAPIDQPANPIPAPTSGDRKNGVETPEAPLVEMHDAPELGSVTDYAKTHTSDPVSVPEQKTEARPATPASVTKTELAQPMKESAVPAISLAFRGSPEKLQVQPVANPTEFNNRE